MATYTGNSGVVKIGTNTVAEVRRFNISEQSTPIEDTALGDSNKTYKAGAPEVGGTIECHFDHTDSTGQEAMTIGATVSLELLPLGAGSGLPTYSCSAEITGIDGPDNSFDEIVSRTFTWRAAGTLTKGTQT